MENISSKVAVDSVAEVGELQAPLSLALNTTDTCHKSVMAEQVEKSSDGAMSWEEACDEVLDPRDLSNDSTGNVDAVKHEGGTNMLEVPAPAAGLTAAKAPVAPVSFAVEGVPGQEVTGQAVEEADGEYGTGKAAQGLNGAEAAEQAVEDADGTEADGNTCAICLEQIPAADISMVKDCEHVYCVYCILKWATCKETPWCPQCKSPFSYLYCYRQLDGTLTDFAIEESVTLLKRATWFEERVKTEEKGKKLSEDDAVVTAVSTADDWYHEFYEDFDDGNEDEEVEEFYFSRAAGHARIVIANRRWGEGGYMRSGRMYATPSSGSSSHGKAKSKGVGKSGKAQLNHVYGSSPPAPSFMGTSPSNAAGTSPPGSGAGSSAGKPGRRAKRNAKRVAADGGIQA